MRACPDETTLSDFLAGLLAEESRSRVLAHVEGCSHCQWVLAAGNGAPPPAGHPDAPTGQSASRELARGSTLSRYVVLERIGSGAMGVVYAAYDPELDRQVALKVLRSEGRHVAELQRRLMLEAQALARLSHANVVAVHDVGMYEEGVFLAMELVEGTTLAEWLKQPRPWTEVLRVFREAGRGLAAAHAAGLVHRDFKPANVLVGEGGRVWVTDFGMARPLNREQGTAPLAPSGASTSSDTPLTRTGALLGTPAYMAPELLQGQRGDALSDQFSFCVALYEALFGVRPFRGDTLEEMAQAAREARVRPPDNDAKVPAWLRRTVLRGLHARPEERFPSMEALLASLAPAPRGIRARVIATASVAALLGATVAYGVAGRSEARCAQEVEKLSAIWGPEQRERIHAAFLATGAPFASVAWEKLAVVLDAHATQWRALRTEACMAAEGGDTETAWQTETCLDARLWQLAAVTEVLEKADTQTVQNAQQLAASLEGIAGCQDAPTLTSRPRPPEALRPRVDEARRKLAQAEAQLTAGRYAQGLALTSALVEELQGIDYRPLTGEVLLVHGHLLGKAGKPKEAEEILYRAVWAAEAGRDDETTARAWSLLLWVVGDQLARAADSERLSQHARAAVDRLGRERFPAIATELHLSLSTVLLMQGKLEQAEAEVLQGLELSRAAHGPDSPRAASLIHQLGRIRNRQLRFEEALALHRQGLELRERFLGPEHPDLAESYNGIGALASKLGRRKEAVAAYYRVLALRETSHDPESIFIASPLHNLGMELRLEGRLQEARQHLERARAIHERIHGPDHPLVANGFGELARVALDEDRFDEAIALCQQAVERFQRALGPSSPRLVGPLKIRAQIHLRAGHYAQAQHDLREAQALLVKEEGPDTTKLVPVLLLMADVALATDKPREAIELSMRAVELDERSPGAGVVRIAVGLSTAAEAHLALRAPEEAMPLLERARKLYVSDPGEARNAGWAAFLLARALVERRTDRDPERAALLAEEARSTLEGVGPRGRRELQKVVAWQRRERVR